jgi:Rad3-related DNA helicase
MQDFFVVVDEAHNLPDFARGLASADLSRPQLSRARDEALRHGNPDVGGARLLAFLAALDGIVVRAASELLVPGEEDALIPPDWLETELMGAFAKTSVALRKIVGSLEEYAEGVRDAKRREGKVPRSYVGGVARFLRIHLEGEEAYARLVCAEPAAATESAGDTHRAGRPGSFAGGTRNQRLLATPQPSREDGRAASPELSPEFPAPDAAFPAGERTGPEGAGASARARLECFALDPSSVTEILLNAAGSLHMSGTLRPLEAYRETVGVPSNTPCYLVPSALPPENRLLLIHPEVTTRYEEVRRFPDMWRKIGAELASIRASTPRNVMVFVPSHDVAGRLRSFLPTAIVEEPGASQGDLMEAVRRFKGARGATFIAVIGGRVAEGLDFPDDELEVAAIVGLPFPKPTARQRALERYYDARTHGRGFEIASRAPMLRRVLQAAGRVVRSPTDRGVVVVLDKRASLFADEFGEVRIERKPGEAIIAFFRGEASAVPPFARVEREDS